MADTELLPLPPIEIAQRTDPGRDPSKQVNEDSVGSRETRFGHLCVVCDGMGGHADGQEASAAALAAIFAWFDEAPNGSAPSEVLRDALTRANEAVRAIGTDASVGAHPGSTVVSILVHPAGTEVAHVGDSRAYLLHEGQIFQVTRDHSMVQQMVDAHLLTPAQAAVHPDANKITRALGIDETVDVEVRPQPVAHVAGDVLVLCSDGLSDLVEAPEILQIASTDPPPQAAGKLVDLANARGGHDNITVLVVRIRMSVTSRPSSVPPTIVATPPPPGVIPPAPAVSGGTPPFGAAHATPPLGTPRLPRAVSMVREPAKSQVPLFVALALGAVAILVAVIVLVVHASERGGRSQAVNPSMSGPIPSAISSPSTVLDVAPSPSATAPAEPFDGGKVAPLILPSAHPPGSAHRRPAPAPAPAPTPTAL